MAGVKGSGGPPPKRSDQRRRTNKTAGEERKANATRGERGECVIPGADESWHPIAKQWFEALKSSGQRAEFESSDWATAAVLAEAVSRELNPQPVVDKDGNVTFVSAPMKGATLSAFLKGCTALLVTEGDRRRAAIELQRPQPADEAQPADVTSLASWKAGMGA